MSNSMAERADSGPHTRCDEPKKRMAKVELPVVTLHDKRRDYGQILRRSRDLAGMNRDQTADALGVDPAQISRWESGDENAQTFRYQAHPVLKSTLLIAQAEATQGAIVRTLIEVERKVG